MTTALHVVHDAVTGVATVTIDRALRRNALDRGTVTELRYALARLDREPRVRCLVLTGVGTVFCAGADLKELATADRRTAFAIVRAGQALTLRVEAMRVPVIAALNGHAFGGGLELALAADIRVCSGDAQLGLPEVTIGTVPGWGGTQRSVRLLGMGRALDLLLTGRRVDAREALLLGLVDRVVPAGALPTVVRELAEAIARNSPTAVREVRRAARLSADRSLPAGLRAEAVAARRLIAHPDRAEGMRALAEKRAPRWEDAAR